MHGMTYRMQNLWRSTILIRNVQNLQKICSFIVINSEWPISNCSVAASHVLRVEGPECEIQDASETDPC